MNNQNEALITNDILPDDSQESEDDIISNNVGEAVLFNTDWTVETIQSQISKGNINLDPEFQRRDAWDDARKSKLIESIICGFPIPNIVLAEDKKHKGKYIVIDGKQRLFSIFGFLSNKFKLKTLKLKPDLNGFYFQDFDTYEFQEIRNVIENQPIRTVIIRNWPSESFLYSVFYRLNSGSLPLSPQELRKALHGGKLLNYIDEFIINSHEYKKIFGNKLDKRMRDTELVLRFIAFERSLENYKGDLKSFLDKEVIFFDQNWAKEVESLNRVLERFTCALDLSSKIFESNSFKKWNGEKYERSINRAIFDIVCRYFGDKTIVDSACNKKQEIIIEFQKLCVDDQRFKDAIERSTKLSSATNYRYESFGNVLAKILNLTLDNSSMRLF